MKAKILPAREIQSERDRERGERERARAWLAEG